MILARPSGGIAAALSLCLAATAFGAPHKPVKHSPGRVTHTVAAPAKPADATAPSPIPGDVLLYSGRPASGEGLTLTAFGGGAVEDSTEQSFEKGHSLKITTLDAYQGARLTFGTPVALGDLADKTRFLSLTLRLSATPGSAGQPMIGPPGFPAGFPPGVPPGFFPGGPGTGPGGYAPGGQVATGFAPAVQNVHLVLTLANGVKTDVLRPLPTSGEGQSGVDQWVNVGIPLSALGFPVGAPSPLRNLTIAGDDYAVMYVGEIKITQDDTPVTAFAGDQQTVAIGQPFVLKGSGGGGLSALHYGWTLDAADGTPEQTSGPSVTTQYLKAGDHTVTLTVSDIDGIKRPATSTTVIHVR